MLNRLSKTLLVISLIVLSGFLLAKIRVPYGDNLKQHAVLLPLEEDIADSVGVYFWAGNAGGSQGEIIQTGSELLENIGAANIRITMGAKSDQDYKGAGCIANFSLKNLATRADFNEMLSNPDFKTIMITAYDGVSFPDCFTKNYLNPNFYTSQNTQRIQQEYTDFAKYLSAFAGKTFIISNWEGDNDIYCGAAYGATAASCPNYQQAMAGFKKWIGARTAGIRASGASNVFSAVEFNIVRNLKSRGLPSVLYDVIPNVDADYFSYSSYESINALYSGDNGAQLKADVATIKNVLSSAGKNPNNLIIGEYGFDQGGREEIKNKLKIITQTISELKIKRAFVWNLLDAGGPFGLYDSASVLTSAGEYFCDILDGSACGPPLTITNITEPSRNPNFWTVDSWRLEIKNSPPNSPVQMCAEQNDQPTSCTPVEDIGFAVSPTTDANGGWVLENSWAGWDDESLYGDWKEWALVGDVKSTAIRFTVSAPDLKSTSAFYIPESERSSGGSAGINSSKLSALFGSSNQYSQQLNAENGTPPYTWSIIRGELPAGLNLNPAGKISGTISSGRFFNNIARAAGNTGVGVEAKDSANRKAVADIAIAVAATNAGTTKSSGLVPCGRSTGTPEEMKPCTTCDLFALASRIINFVLFTVVPAVAVLFYLIGGLMILLGGAYPGLVTTGRNFFWNTTIGLFIIFGAWMITNTVLKSIAGNNDISNHWYSIQCTNPIQPKPPSTQRYNCSSEKICVVNPSGPYTNSTCDGKCTAAQTYYMCTTDNPSQCVVDPQGSATDPDDYTTSNCDGECTPAQTFYMCTDANPSQCVVDPQGSATDPDNYTTSNCDGECQPLPTPVTISSSLSDAIINQSYAQPVNASGGISPYGYSVSAGSLPPGLSLSTNGLITGTPTTAGDYTFTVKVEDSTTPTKQSVTKELSVKVVTVAAGVVISNVAVSNITAIGATVAWVTDKPSTSQVEYGTSSSFGSSTTINNTPGTSHSVTITGLTTNTTYSYRAKSSVIGFTAISSTSTFKTLAATGPLACLFTGINLCQGQALVYSNGKLNPSSNVTCSYDSCNQYSDMINRVASQVGISAALIKGVMAVESNCKISADGGDSFGLMQLQPATANTFAERCGVAKGSVTSPWLKDPANAEKSICIGAQYLKSLSNGASCGSSVRNILAGYGGEEWCRSSNDCSGDTSCDGSPVRKWECLYDTDPTTKQKICNGDNTVGQAGSKLNTLKYSVVNKLYCYEHATFTGPTAIPPLTCPLKALNPITDSAAQAMESGQTVVWSTSNAQVQQNLTKLQTEFNKLKRLFPGAVVNSAYRPLAYQSHLYEIFQSAKQVENDPSISSNSSCTATLQKLTAEEIKHGVCSRSSGSCLVSSPNGCSPHVKGAGIDIGGISNLSSINTTLQQNGIDLSWQALASDPVHFNLENPPFTGCAR